MLKLFVYGTLKPGESNYQRFCAGKVVEEKRAIAIGLLFALPFGYPAMTNGDATVRGYLLTFALKEVLHELDRLEGYHRERPAEQNEYNRQLIETFNLSGEPLETAWVYLEESGSMNTSVIHPVDEMRHGGFIRRQLFQA